MFFLCSRFLSLPPSLFFFFNDTATTEIYTLSLHDALPISRARNILGPKLTVVTILSLCGSSSRAAKPSQPSVPVLTDRKSTRLNSSHGYISYAVFCLKKKKKTEQAHSQRCTTMLDTVYARQ